MPPLSQHSQRISGAVAREMLTASRRNIAYGVADVLTLPSDGPLDLAAALVQTPPAAPSRMRRSVLRSEGATASRTLISWS